MKTLTLALLAAALPASAETFPLGELVRRTLARDPAAAAARARSDEARRARSEAAAMSLPRVGAGLSYMRSDDPLFVFGAILQERAVEGAHFGLGFLRDPGYRTRVQGSLEAGVPVFTGLRLSSARRQAGLAADAAGAAERAVGEDRRRAAVDAALSVLAARARKAALDARAASASSMVEDARRLTKSGLVLGSDFFAAEALLAKLRAQAAFEARRLEGAEARLALLAGGPGDPSGRLDGAPPPLPDAAALAASAAGRRGDLEARARAAEAAEEGRRAAARSLLPTVEAFGRLSDTGRGFLDGGTARLVGLRAELPFGDPAYAARRGRAAAAAAAAAEEARSAREAAAQDIVAARAAYAGAADALPSVLEARDKAAESLERFRPLYRQGRQSVLEVLRAEDALAQAELAVTDARLGLYAGWAGLSQAAGTLDDGAVAALEKALEASR